MNLLVETKNQRNNGFMEGEIIVMDKKINFTQEELQLLYAACMSYGDKLSEVIKSIPNEETDKLSNRAKESWNIARKVTEYMDESNYREEVEICPHCMGENIIKWNVKRDGYEIVCQHCGEKIMLCDACIHSDDNKHQKCDWCEDGGCFRKRK